MMRSSILEGLASGTDTLILSYRMSNVSIAKTLRPCGFIGGSHHFSLITFAQLLALFH